MLGSFTYSRTTTPLCGRLTVTALKQALKNAPILTPPDRGLPFVLDADASTTGVGEVLSQVGLGR